MEPPRSRHPSRSSTHAWTGALGRALRWPRLAGVAGVLVVMCFGEGVSSSDQGVDGRPRWNAERAPSEIVYGGDERFPPYEYLDGGGQPAGLNIDLIRAIARVHGVALRVKLMPWPRARAALLSGEIDVAAMYRSASRVREVDFAIPHELVYHEMFTRVGHAPLQSLADLAGKRVLVQRDACSIDALTELGFLAENLIAVTSEPDALTELARGGGEVALVTQTSGHPFHERLALSSQVVPNGPPVLLSEYAFVTQKGRPHLIETLNEGLNAVRVSGEYDRLYSHWINPPRWAEHVREVLWVLVAVVFGMVGIIAWNQMLRRRMARQTEALRKEYEAKERAQQALLEAEVTLRRAQKMEAIGRLAGGIAHDFNNILAVILNYGLCLRERLVRINVPADEVDEILATSERAVRLTRQLLAFSRSTPIEKGPIDLCAVLRDTVAMLQRLVGEQVRIDTSMPEGPVIVMAESTQIEQMLLNLAANARDAMPNGGRLVIGLARVSLDAPNRWDLPVGTYASIIVSDDGIGMDEALLGRIFEPFFTTKQPGKGTGLGLATVFANVTKLNGKVTVDSQVGRGTTFTLMLPEASPVEVSQCRSTGLKVTHGASETILLVEDDHALRRAAKLALVREGHVVIEARDGEEAERLGRDSTRFTVLITDVIVPKKVGPDIANELRKAHPDLRVLYVSGYLHETDSLDLSAPRTAYLAKPYTGPMLVEALRRLAAGSLPATEPSVPVSGVETRGGPTNGRAIGKTGEAVERATAASVSATAASKVPAESMVLASATVATANAENASASVATADTEIASAAVVPGQRVLASTTIATSAKEAADAAVTTGSRTSGNRK